ncbi:penicillin-binding protein activator [Chitinimonas sp. PSY-7]|uniref:penicillin-binding protein activator n=1 Tax=Chitinimonas sp. PSY-7 TaxID=3459088 RepID=UPI0040402237
MHGYIPSRWTAVLTAALLYLGMPIAASAEEVTPTPPTPATTPAKAQAHIALILPTKAKSFAVPAEAIQLGAQAAEEKLGDEVTPKLRLYPTTERDDDALLAYQQAVANGAIGVIGPLTRGAIAKLAEHGALEVPVLALNSLEGLSNVSNLYGLGLSIEAEARQMARLMQTDGSTKPLLIETDGALSKRTREAFSNEWHRITGSLPIEVKFSESKDGLNRLKENVRALAPDAIFLAADQKKARLIRPYLGADQPVYATSQVWSGKFGRVSVVNNDLLGVRFVDMPWLLDPYHNDMLQFKHASKPLSPDMERLYALGLDAYRLSLQLVTAAPGANIELEGVTGVLRLSDSGQFSRELLRSEVGSQPRTPKPEPEPVVDPAATSPLTN